MLFKKPVKVRESTLQGKSHGTAKKWLPNFRGAREPGRGQDDWRVSEKGLDLPQRLSVTQRPTTVPGSHVRLSKACHLPGSVQNKPGEENRGKHLGQGG